jgi:hypothetical protein
MEANCSLSPDTFDSYQRMLHARTPADLNLPIQPCATPSLEAVTKRTAQFSYVDEFDWHTDMGYDDVTEIPSHQLACWFLHRLCEAYRPTRSVPNYSLAATPLTLAAGPFAYVCSCPGTGPRELTPLAM